MIPPSPNVSQPLTQTLDKAVEETVIHANACFNTPQEILWVNDAAIATLGNFSASTGKAKSRKTFNVSAIVAAALRNKTVLSYRANCRRRSAVFYILTRSKASSIVKGFSNASLPWQDIWTTRTILILSFWECVTQPPRSAFNL